MQHRDHPGDRTHPPVEAEFADVDDALRDVRRETGTGEHRHRDGQVEPEPRFGIAAGVRFTVIRRAGSGHPAFAAADRTRSRASPNEVSGSPMMLNAGS